MFLFLQPKQEKVGMVYIITIICLTIIAVLAMILNIKRLREKSKGLTACPKPVARLIIDHALRQLNCKVDWNNDNGNRVAHFTYQGGHFNLNLEKDSPYVRMSFLFFFKADVADLEQIRTVCNLCNLNTDTVRVVYTLDNKEAKVDLHILGALPIIPRGMKGELERAMADAFRWQNAFISKYKDVEKEAHKQHDVDSEKASAQYARDLQLIREQEMTHQENGPDWHEDQEQQIDFKSVLSAAMGLTDIIPIKFTLVIDEQLTVIDDPDTILEYPVSKPLISNGSFRHSSATGRLDFYDPRDPITPRHMTVDFEREESTKDTLFYRMTLALAPVSLSKNVSEVSEQHRKQMTSLLLGYELSPQKERVAHFRYVWKEAMGKMQNGDTKDMTDEEKMLADMQDPHLAYNYYHGRDLYLRKRFYEALLPLENAFHAVTKSYDAHNRKTVTLTDELAYFIGCSYMHLHQYDRACYYLQLILPTAHQSYSEAYINCLVNGGDYRAMDILNGLLGSLQMMMEHINENDDDENEGAQQGPGKEQLQGFINFVKRRKAYLLVSLKRYDEAERILKQLLDDPDNSDFALNELAYIQKNK